MDNRDRAGLDDVLVRFLGGSEVEEGFRCAGQGGVVSRYQHEVSLDGVGAVLDGLLVGSHAAHAQDLHGVAHGGQGGVADGVGVSGHCGNHVAGGGQFLIVQALFSSLCNGLEAVPGAGSGLPADAHHRGVIAPQLAPVGDLAGVQLGDLLYRQIGHRVFLVHHDGDAVNSHHRTGEAVGLFFVLQVPAGKTDVAALLADGLDAGAGAGRVIVEGFVQFDYEITQLTVRHSAGTTFLKPVGHVQVDGDYRESWQPQVMSEKALQKAQDIALKVTDALGGYGIFGVELFIKGDDVLFSEVSPRPHDTGMVTMISQDMSQFALHARAVLGLPVPGVRFYGPSASRAIVVEGDTDKVVFGNLDEVLSEEGVQMRIFGKPEVVGHRRLGVILATADTVEEARAKADRAYKKLKVKLLPR